jgi:hypothetical protein
MTMNLIPIPSQIEQIEEKVREVSADVPWTRALAISTLVTSACLLIAGKRKSSMLAAAAGTALLVAEDPDGVRRFWNQVPDYVRKGEEFLGRVEGFVEQVAEQGDRVRKVLNRA